MTLSANARGFYHAFSKLPSGHPVSIIVNQARPPTVTAAPSPGRAPADAGASMNGSMHGTPDARGAGEHRSS